MQEFLWGMTAMLALMSARVPIAISMGIAGFIGLGLLRNWNASMVSVTSVVFETGFSYTFSVLPLFILMGNVVVRTLLPNVSTGTVFRGVMPFVVAECFLLAMLVVFPAVSLYLPTLLFDKWVFP